MSNIKTVYVRLTDEGNSARPTSALDLSNGAYKLLPTPDYNPENEMWEFPPDSVVHVEKKTGINGEYLLAVKAE